MIDEQCDRPGSEAEAGRSEAAGQAFDPMQPAGEEREEAAPSRPRVAPIGRPVAAEEYERLKEEAAVGRGPRGRNAQEDPAG